MRKETNRRTGDTYLPQINLVRAIAILCVITVHATSQVTVDLSRNSILYPVYNFLNIFFRVGTPTFIFLSAFILFYSYVNRKWNVNLLGRFYKNRGLFIIVPYIVFSLLYFAVLNEMYYDLSLKEAIPEFLLKLATGNAYAHLYFVFINVQFYLIFPLMLWLFKKKRGWMKHAWWVGLAVQWIFYFLNHQYFHVVSKGSVALSYAGYYMLGVTFGMYYQVVLAALKKRYIAWALYSLWLTFSLFNVFIYAMYRIDGVSWHAAIFELAWNLHTLTTAVVLFHIAFILYPLLNQKIRAMLLSLGMCSFGIYLIHPLILFVYRHLIAGGGSVLLYNIKILGGWLFALLLSWLVVLFTFRYIKMGWVVFGAVPVLYKQKKAAPFSRNHSSKEKIF